MPKVKIDRDLCIGCGTCPAICPKIFKLDGEGKSTVLKKGSSEGSREWVSAEELDDSFECAKNAAASCPTQAILIEEK